MIFYLHEYALATVLANNEVLKSALDKIMMIFIRCDSVIGERFLSQELTGVVNDLLLCQTEQILRIWDRCNPRSLAG
jgi:hypothetical protein